MKTIRFTKHALEQCRERGATEEEVREAIEQGSREAASREGNCAASIFFMGNCGRVRSTR